VKRYLVVLALLASANCSLLTFKPTARDIQQVRQIAARIADAVVVVEVALDEVGTTISRLPLTVAQKDAVDCLILKVNGHDAPSATVVKVCGPLPPTAEAPIGKALRALRTVTSEPGLCGVVKTLLDVLNPLLDRLQAAGASMTVLRTALGFTLRFAGGCAS
jgi:hypothetical protein